MIRNKHNRWVSGIGTVVLLMASAVLLCFVDLVGAKPLESWDDKIPNATQRFKVLPEFSGAAVLDKETQLVWEQSPALTTGTWSNARIDCIKKNVGGRKGWRLPSIPEMTTLIDPSVAVTGPTAPVLPPGHPFTDVVGAGYWSATTVVPDPENPTPTSHAWMVDFLSGNVISSGDKSFTNGHVWCVRGGMNADAY